MSVEKNKEKSQLNKKLIQKEHKKKYSYDVRYHKGKDGKVKILSYFKKYAGFAFLSFIMAVISVLGEVASPLILSKLIDEGISKGDIQYVKNLGMLMVIITAVAVLVNIANVFLRTKIGNGFATRLRRSLYKKIQEFSFANIDKFKVSSLITRLTQDVESIGHSTTVGMNMIFKAPLLFVLSLIFALRTSKKITLYILIIIPVIILLVGYIAVKARKLFKLGQEQVDQMNNGIKQNLSGMRVVKTFNLQKNEKDKFDIKNNKLKDIMIKAVELIIKVIPIISILINSIIIIVMIVGKNYIISETMTTGTLVSLISYITYMLQAFMVFSMFFVILFRSLASLDRIKEVLNAESEIEILKNAKSYMEDFDIEFKNVSFKYPDTNEYVIKNASFNLKKGQKLGVIGNTGSAKSTLIQLLPRLYDINEGEILIGGVNIKECTPEAILENIGYVLQENQLFSGTIRDNIKVGKQNATDQEIIEALKKAQAWEFVSKLPEQIDHVLYQGGVNLSGGQKQRLTIARALVKNPKILVLDDSTSAIDALTEKQLWQSLNRNYKDLTQIIISQRISSIKNADKILVMDKGEIVGIGRNEELKEKNEIYKQIYESQIKENGKIKGGQNG